MLPLDSWKISTDAFWKDFHFMVDNMIIQTSLFVGHTSNESLNGEKYVCGEKGKMQMCYAKW